MAEIERSPTPELDEVVIDEPEPEMPVAKPKKVKEDKRKKPRTEKQIAAFEHMRQKRKDLIAQKKAGKQQQEHAAPPTMERMETPHSAVTPSVVNNYFYSDHPPPPRAPTPEPVRQPEPKPQYEEPPTVAREIYFG